MKYYFIEYAGDYSLDDGTQELYPFDGTFEGEYPDFNTFIAEANKILREGGYLKNDESLLDNCFTESFSKDIETV
jgi:hypothetical protein